MSASDRSPTLLIQRLRDVRSLALWALGPADRLLLRARGKRDLPPLWLRRHVGPLRSFETAARGTGELIDELAPLSGGELVLDVGCGCGAMVPELRARLGAAGRYVGFDVHRPSIRWCQKRWGKDERLAFHLAELSSPYTAYGSQRNRGAILPVTSYRFPATDSTVQLVLAKSIFTHFLAPEVAHYLAEIRRVLARNGKALVSFFLFDDRPGAAPPPAFLHGDPDEPGLRWRRRGHPRAAVAYGKSYAERLVAGAGLHITTLRTGFWPGKMPRPSGQDLLVLTPAPPEE